LRFSGVQSFCHVKGGTEYGVALPTGKRLQDSLVSIVDVFLPNNENHFLDLIVRGEKIPRRIECNEHGFFKGVPVSATTDCRKRYRFDFIFHRKL
jgi:hypothetical protein